MESYNRWAYVRMKFAASHDEKSFNLFRRKTDYRMITRYGKHIRNITTYYDK